MPTLEHQNTVYESKNKTIIIYDSLYDGEPCFAIVHTPTGHIEIIDHNTGVLDYITRRMNRSVALVCDQKKNGRILKFRRNGKERSISLRLYVYGKYNGLSPKQMQKRKIMLDDDSALNDDIQDLRSCNLYDAGELRPHTGDRDIQIISRPGTEEMYIAITFHNRENRIVEYLEYTPELYEMLARPTYCNLRYNAHNDRAIVIVHFSSSKNGYILENLSKFILIYNTHFDRYRNMSGPIKRFVHDYKKLSELYNDKHVAHINACKWNNCAANLMFMDETHNSAMSDWIKLFSSPYHIFTAASKTGEILIELSANGLFNANDSIVRYYKCDSPADFLDWQKVFLGKQLTGELHKLTFTTQEGLRHVLTPRGMIMANEANRETAKANEADIWTWLDHRDALLSMDSGGFIIWKEGMGQPVIHLPDSAANGQPFVVPFGAGYAVVKVTPLGQEKRG